MAVLHTSPLICRLLMMIRAFPIGFASLACNKILISLVSQSNPKRMIFYKEKRKDIHSMSGTEKSNTRTPDREKETTSK